MRNKLVLLVMMLISVLASVKAQDDSEMSANERQAKRIFNQAYQQVFGEQGATLRYDVNITGIYKTYGTIWYKGKKSRFEDAKMNSWNDGTTVYTIKKKKKKKEVEIHETKNNKSDKYSSKFKFVPENFNYSIANHEEGLMLTLKGTGSGKETELRTYQSENQDRLYLDDYQGFQFQVGWYNRRDAQIPC